MNAHRLLLAAVCLAAPSNAAARRADPPPTEIEGAAVGAQVRRDLGTLLQPGGSVDTNTASSQERAQGHLRTRPHATMIAGVCRRDELIVAYAGPGRYEAGAAANMVQPFGVTARAWFRVLRELDPSAPASWGPPFEGECAALNDAERRGWFTASGEYEARSGYQTFLAAARQLRAPAHGIAGCRDNASQRSCREVVQSPARIVRIAECPAPPRRGCYSIGLSDSDDSYEEQLGVTLRFRWNSRGEPRIYAIEIQWPVISI